MTADRPVWLQLHTEAGDVLTVAADEVASVLDAADGSSAVVTLRGSSPGVSHRVLTYGHVLGVALARRTCGVLYVYTGRGDPPGVRFDEPADPTRKP
jgi:hypothetical protein